MVLKESMCMLTISSTKNGTLRAFAWCSELLRFVSVELWHLPFTLLVSPSASAADALEWMLLVLAADYKCGYEGNAEAWLL